MDKSVIAILAYVAAMTIILVVMARPDRRLRSHFSPEYALRRQQREADAAERETNARRAAKALKAQRNLEWALANPNKAACRRLLEEKLDEIREQLKRIETSMKLDGYTLERFGPEAEQAIVAIAEAETRKAAVQALAAQIREALGVTA